MCCGCGSFASSPGGAGSVGGAGGSPTGLAVVPGLTASVVESAPATTLPVVTTVARRDRVPWWWWVLLVAIVLRAMRRAGASR